MRLDERTGDRHLTRAETAACLVALLQRQGAVFTVDRDGYFMADLNPIAGMTFERADWMSRVILDLRAEISAVLAGDSILH